MALTYERHPVSLKGELFHHPRCSFWGGVRNKGHGMGGGEENREKTQTLGSLTDRHPHSSPVRSPPETRQPHPGMPRSSKGLGALTALPCNGAEVSVAGQGGCRLLLHGAAPSRPAPGQALHGPGPHAAPAAGRALRETQAGSPTAASSIRRSGWEPGTCTPPGTLPALWVRPRIHMARTLADYGPLSSQN